MDKDQDFDAAWDEFFSGENTPEDETPDDAEETNSTDEDTTESDADDDNKAEGEDDEDEGDTKDAPGSIPYKRFAAIAKDRREAKQKVKDLEQQLEALKSQQMATRTDESSEEDRLLREILGDDEGDYSPEDSDPALTARIAQLETAQAQAEAKQAEAAFEQELSVTLAKFQGVDRKVLIDETIRTEGKKSLDEIAQDHLDNQEISKAEALADFFEQHPDLAEAYKAKQKVDGDKVKPKAAPSLKNTATGKAPQSLDPKDGESNSDFLSRMWDTLNP